MTATPEIEQPRGWLCPACGKAHGPHVDTCPVQKVGGIPVDPIWPITVPVVWINTRRQGFYPTYIDPNIVTICRNN